MSTRARYRPWFREPRTLPAWHWTPTRWYLTEEARDAAEHGDGLPLAGQPAGTYSNMSTTPCATILEMVAEIEGTRWS